MHHTRTTRGHRSLAAAAFAGAAALVAAGCGASGGGSGKDAGNSGESKPTSLPVAAKTRSVDWVESGRHTAHKLRVTPKLARGAESDLKHVKLDDDLKGQVPYYLTVSYTNNDGRTVDHPAPENDFSITDAKGGEAHSVMTFGGWGSGSGLPSACRAHSPDSLKAGGKATACEIFMMPKGHRPAAVTFASGDYNPQTTPYVWKVAGGQDAEALAAHKPAESAWKNAGKASTKVRVTPKSVRAGKVSDLSRFRLDKDQKQAVPYYVTVEYRNDGGADLYPDMQDGVRLGTDTGRRVDKLNLLDVSGQDPVPGCPESKPDSMVKPKKTVAQCAVYLVPKGDKPATVGFAGKGAGARTLTWHAK